MSIHTKPLARVTVSKINGERETILCGTHEAARFAEAFARVVMGVKYPTVVEGVAHWTVTKQKREVASGTPKFYVRVEWVHTP